jgi:hypothetical protein
MRGSPKKTVQIAFLTLYPLRAEAVSRWAVYDLEARKLVSRRYESAREAIDDAIEHQQTIQRGRRGNVSAFVLP